MDLSPFGCAYIDSIALRRPNWHEQGVRLGQVHRGQQCHLSLHMWEFGWDERLLTGNAKMFHDDPALQQLPILVHGRRICGNFATGCGASHRIHHGQTNDPIRAIMDVVCWETGQVWSAIRFATTPKESTIGLQRFGATAQTAQVALLP